MQRKFRVYESREMDVEQKKQLYQVRVNRSFNAGTFTDTHDERPEDDRSFPDKQGPSYN